jgi:hypothetical protein
MEEELKRRFTAKKLDDLLNDNLNLLPTILCERENPRIIELVRRNVLYAIKFGKFIPFTHEHIRPSIKEGLDKTKGNTNWGDLYIKVNIN